MASTNDRTNAETGGRATSWRDDLATVARRVMADKELETLRGRRAEDLGKAGDLVVAAHLDDLLFVERARYHRARREVGRAMAEGDKQEVAVARDNLRAAAASLGVVRLQRELATGDVKLPVDDGGRPTKPSKAD
jgi:hypothetical protein